LRLTPFIFIKFASIIPERRRFSGMDAVSGPKKPFFSTTVLRRLLSIDPCALF
jgi:hypothetical protein